MRVGFVGLGRMGMNMVLRLLERGHEVVAYNRTYSRTEEAARHGAIPARTLEELVDHLSPPRAIWLMVPAGQPVDENLEALSPHLEPGDILIDGGNSYYRDTLRRAQEAHARGISLVDVGTSGGIWGRQVGYCLMIGGDPGAVQQLEPLFQALAPEGGFAHVGPTGAGHYVKMIHNGIEYGMLQALGEGFALLHASPFSLDLPQIATLWNHGSVIRSWLMELAARALARDPHLEGIRGYVEDSGEGRWTVQEAVDRAVPAPVLTLSLMARFRSRQEDAFSDRLIAALRHEFGGHAVVEAPSTPSRERP